MNHFVDGFKRSFAGGMIAGAAFGLFSGMTIATATLWQWQRNAPVVAENFTRVYPQLDATRDRCMLDHECANGDKVRWSSMDRNEQSGFQPYDVLVDDGARLVLSETEPPKIECEKIKE